MINNRTGTVLDMLSATSKGEQSMRFITVTLSTILIGSTFTFSELTANASAQQNSDSTQSQPLINQKQRLKMLDKDNDQRLSFIEAMADLNFAENFLELDQNKDGYISSQELNAPQSMTTGQLKYLLGTTALIQL